MKFLMQNEAMQEFLVMKKGIPWEDAIENMFGWDPASQEFWVPIKNEIGRPIDIETFPLTDESDWLEAALQWYKNVDLSESIKSVYYNKNISFSGIAIGKELSPYTIPHEIKATCQEGNPDRKKCKQCILNNNQEVTWNLKISDEKDKELLVSMIGCSNQQVVGLVRKYMGIPTYNTCRQVELDLNNRIDVEEIRLTSEVDHDRIDTEYVVHKCLVFGPQIQTNARYQCWGTTYNDPRSQHAIHIIKKVHSKRDSLSQWKLDKEAREKLEVFSVKDPQDEDQVREKLHHIQSDLAANVTKMYKRESVIQATDFVYCTPLHFKFMGQKVLKGWGECAIIGDTRTGKTETVKNLVHHYRAGEFVTSGENTTLAGLLGGVQQTHNGRWSLTWGKMPMNDRRAVIIDEADTLAEQGIMGHLSGVRSSGVAELVKIQTQRTMARTRLLFIANPQKPQLSVYNHGVDVIPEIFGKAQDISRLDFAIFCSKDDVSDRDINAIREATVPHLYTSELCHERIMYAWTRGIDDAIWADGSEKLILDLAVTFGEKYIPDIPLVLGAEFRIKLAKMSYSIALQTFSVNENASKVVIYPSHVKVAAKWLREQYDSPVSGYYDFSMQKKTGNKIRNEIELDTLMAEDVELINSLLSVDKLQLGDAEDLFETDRTEARKVISKLRKCSAIIKHRYYYVKTPHFIRWLKKKRLDLNKQIPF